MNDRRELSDPTPRTDGGRHHVALLFSDLCDSTALGERIDPEEAVGLRQQIEAVAQQVVARHGGRVIQVYGDGLLAVFGYPAAREDDARRAVEAAVDLHATIRLMRWELSLPPGFEVRLHSAVDAGRVFARQGDALHGQYELIGDAVNTAARLCEAAGRDEVWVSDSVLSGIEAFFVVEEAAPIALKGKQRPVRAHRVSGRSAVLSRFDARAIAGLSPFIGRSAELELLQHRLGEHAPGEPQTTLIIGPPGIGKTRLIQEFRRTLPAPNARVLHGSCDSYGGMPVLGPFLQILRQIFGIESVKEKEAATRIVAEQARSLGAEVDEQLPTLLELLSLRAPSEKETSRSNPLARAIPPVFSALTSRERVLLVLDDWQWSDGASREALDEIRRQYAPEGLFIVVGTRGDSDPVLQDVEAFRLQPFSEAESAAFIRALRPSLLDLGVTRAIHERTGGNPLFVEELCRSLPDDAVAGERALEESNLPTSVQGLIHARVASLPAEHVRVLEAASVVGSEFSPSLVARAVPDADVARILRELARGDLIQEHELGDRFRFKHGITREVVYDSVRLAECRRIHRAIASALEEESGGDAADDSLETLAYHYRGCADHERAAVHAERAGDKAQATSSLDRARFHYSTALSELDRLPPSPERRRQWLGVHEKWAGVYVYSASRHQLVVSETAVRHAADLDDATLGYTEHWHAWMQYVIGEYEGSVETARRALRRAERIGDQRLVAQLLTTLGQAHAAAGEREPALDALNRGLALKRKRASVSSRDVLPRGFAYAVACRGALRADAGEFAAAHRDIGEALDVIGGSGHALEGSLLALEAMVHIYRGDWPACIEAATRCREIASRVNSAYVYAMGSVFAAYAHWEDAATPAALRELVRAVEWLEARDTGLFGSLNYGCVAEAFAAAGDLGRARDYAERALERRKRGDRLGESIAHRALARVAHAEDSSGAATAQHLSLALASARERGSPRDVAVTTLLRAALEVESGRPERAAASAREALAEFERMGMPWHSGRARQMLGVG
ncbi:MAG: AAA family ATPase [Myxococcota bacterium]|nr:AAA family ATPase [Myxococcota bacterium]